MLNIFCCVFCPIVQAEVPALLIPQSAFRLSSGQANNSGHVTSMCLHPCYDLSSIRVFVKMMITVMTLTGAV